MGITAYYVNGVKTCDCTDKGIPVGLVRNCKRCLMKNEIEEEKMLLEKLDDIRFIERRSKSWKWIASTLNVVNPSFIDTRSITKFMSYILKIGLNREVYRRRRCCMYWLDMHYNEIITIFNNNEISIDYNDKRIMFANPNEIKGDSQYEDITRQANIIHNEVDNESNHAFLEYNFFKNYDYQSMQAQEVMSDYDISSMIE